MNIPFLSVCAGIEAASEAGAPFGWRASALSEIEAFPRAVLMHRQGARTGGGGGLGTDFEIGGGLTVEAYGGNNTAGPLNVATVCNAHGGAGRFDFESETFVAHALKAEGFDASEDGTGRGVPLVPVGFRTSGNSGAWETGDRVDALTTGTDPEAQLIAFGSKDFGDDAGAVAPTLRSGGHAGSHANAGTPPAVSSPTGVRRLLPLECERLQGFRDNYTLIPTGKRNWSRELEEVRDFFRRTYRMDITDEEIERLAADGPRYKALGNSWPVNVARWIIGRIDAQMREAAE